MDPRVRCIIVDDEPLAIKLIQKHIELMPVLELRGSFQNPLEAFEFLKKDSVELVFLDIQMPILTGIDFVKTLQTPPSIIFTTAFRQYAVESYELEVIDYLIKPIPFKRFFKAVNKFLNQKGIREAVVEKEEAPLHSKNHIYVNENKKHIKVEFDDILFVESIKDYVRIHISDKRIITKDRMGR